ncbi:MAG: COX aromatic rich motif-containing protein [Devosia sp.]|uniref:COX aromatic rich motif-containing protein n=1 Tax=Devosia sp. TaxID=1871048 RepID=UPI00339AEE12
MFKDTMLDPAGPVSAATRDLFFDSVGLMLIVVLPVIVLTALVVWRYRAGNAAAAYTPHWGGSRLVELGLWFLPVLIVVMLWFVVWNRTHDLDPYKPLSSGQPPLVVQAVALDWQWLFIYPEENIASVNRLVFPVGRPVTIELTSDSVMNSLMIPALGGQIYAMAGMQTELNLMADRIGIYDGRNTMFNGDGFSAQVFNAEAVDVAAFQAFVAEARNAGETLDGGSFKTLSTPTIAGPVRLYSGVEDGLFQSIIASHGSMPHMEADTTTAPHAEHNP